MSADTRVKVPGAAPNTELSITWDPAFNGFMCGLYYQPRRRFATGFHLAFAHDEEARIAISTDGRCALWIGSAMFDLAKESDARKIAEAFALPIRDDRVASDKEAA